LRTPIFDASVGVNVPDEILRGHSHPGEQTVGGELRLSYEMIVTLIGPGFAISPITPEKQTVAEGSPTVWQWQIEAKQEGLRELEATLFALITIDAANPARQRINSYSQKVNVSVKPQTWAEWLKSVRDEVDAVRR